MSFVFEDKTSKSSLSSRGEKGEREGGNRIEQEVKVWLGEDEYACKCVSR